MWERKETPESDTKKTCKGGCCQAQTEMDRPTRSNLWTKHLRAEIIYKAANQLIGGTLIRAPYTTEAKGPYHKKVSTNGLKVDNTMVRRSGCTGPSEPAHPPHPVQPSYQYQPEHGQRQSLSVY